MSFAIALLLCDMHLNRGPLLHLAGCHSAAGALLALTRRNGTKRWARTLRAFNLCTCRSQDYVTPADQQGEGQSQKAHFRSPARLSPNRIKRPRNVMGVSCIS